MKLSILTIISTSCALYISVGFISVSERIQLELNLLGKLARPKEQSFLSEATLDVLRDDFPEWLAFQKKASFEGILKNIGGISDSLDPSEVHEGVVVASPSKISPNYFYQWVRDAALTMKSLVEFIEDKDFEDVAEIQKVIESYIENCFHIQRLDNLSGKFDSPDKEGLGEPKFLATNNAFEQKWGRPQADGPGLRALTIMKYLDLVKMYSTSITNPFLQSPQRIYEEIIKPDLIFVLKNWKKDSFDLWEEICSIHFFNSITQLRALEKGIEFAETFNDFSFLEQLKSGFDELKNFIENESGFSKPSSSHLIETPSLFESGQRSGLDIAVLLGAIHSHDFSGSSSDIPFNIDDGKVLNTLYSMAADMRYRYPVNHNNRIGFSTGVGLGRYPEDIYDGYATSEGNPWFLATASASEIVYKLIYKLNANQENLIIDQLNKDFFEEFIDVVDQSSTITIIYGSETYLSLMDRLMRYSDSFLQVVKDHVDHQGHMSEQFNKYTGFMQGARELTWSYSAVWSAIRWRERASQILD